MLPPFCPLFLQLPQFLLHAAFILYIIQEYIRVNICLSKKNKNVIEELSSIISASISVSSASLIPPP